MNSINQNGNPIHEAPAGNCLVCYGPHGQQREADLPNLYFDSSINCEPTAHEAIIRIMGHDRLLYGTDYPCCHVLGKYLALGSGAQRHSGRGRVLEQRPSCVRKVSARVRGVDRRCVGLLTL
ncbi:MAG: hypothetical protein MK179_22425 [Pirellulaceae bacterium]|nr:hypothetical protein [Pirellulaceae bacterium]